MISKRFLSSLFFILAISVAINAEFYAQYYASESTNERTFTRCFRQQVSSRVESTINYKYDQNWNVLPATLATKKADFAVRWSGYLVPTETGKYEFGVRGDDGFVLTLDETVLLSEWNTQGAISRWTAPQPLLGGMKYKLRLEYFQAGGGAEITLLWKVNGGPEQVIPTDKVKPLSPQDEQSKVVQSPGWQTNFYRSTTTNTDVSPEARFTHFQSDRIDTDVNFPNWDQNWPTRGISGAKDHFAARWTGLVTPPADGAYDLYMMADDGVRVLVNGRPLIAGQSWNQVQAVKEYHTQTTFKANTQYQITVEYFQMQGGAHSQLMWKSASIPKSIIGNKFVAPVTGTNTLNVVPFAGRRYAVLDGTDATLTKAGKQAQFKALPPGWKISTDTTKTRLVAALGKWGADGVVVKDGKVLKTGVIGELKPPSAVNLEHFQMDNTEVFRPDINSNNRVLIETDKLSPGDVDVAVPTIKSTVVFGRQRFASLDATHPATKPGVRDPANSRFGNAFHKLPPGWTIATQNSQTKVITMGTKYSFGGREVITKDGVALDVTNGKQKSTNQMETVTTEDGQFFRPRQPEQRILITQPAENQPDSWQVVRTITNIARVRSGSNVIYYATLDNTRADEGRHECQDVPLAIPAGWKLANRNNEFEQTIIRQNSYQFGARCLIFSDGKGLYTVNNGGNCGDDLLAKSNFDGRDLFAPTDCSIERRVLIQREVSIDKLPANEVCGQCAFWGDPHVTTFSGASWTFSLQKTASYTFLKPKANLEQNFKIWTTNQPWKGIDSITDVYIQWNSETLQFSTQQQGGENYKGFRNGRQINLDQVDNDPNALLVPTKISNRLNAEWVMWGLQTPNGMLIWAGLQRWENINLWTVYVWVPNSLRGATEGICGACGEDQMKWSTGQTITKTANHGDLNKYAGSWVTNGGIQSQFSKRQVAAAIATAGATSEKTCTNKYIKSMGEALCKGLDATRREFCLIDYCATGSLQVVKSAYAAAAVARSTSVQDPRCTANSTVTITNFVNFQGYDFAVLDNTASNTRISGGQTVPLVIPDGWEIAPDTPLSRAFIACSSFGTTCLTLKNGLALSRDLKQCHKGTDNLRYTEGNCVVPVSTSRILLVRSLPFKFMSDQERVFASEVIDKSWAKVGSGYTQVNISELSGNAIRVKAANGQLAGAEFKGAYDNTQRFSIGIWSRVVRQTIATSTSQYGLKVDFEYVDGTTEQGAFIGFDASTTAFNFRHAEVIPTKNVKNVKISAIVSGFEDIEADFSTIYIFGEGGHAANLLKNPTVYDKNSWSVSQGAGFDVALAVDHTGYDASGSIQMDALGQLSKSKDFVASQVIRLTAAQSKGIRGIYFSGWSLQKRVDGEPASGYSLFVNLVFTDGTKTTGIIAAFSEMLSDWQFSERVFRISEGKQIAEIRFAAVFRRHSGLVYFDDMYLTLLPCVDYGTESIDIASGAIGLGHIVTMSGRIMDLPSPGDWIIYQDEYINIIGRFIPSGKSALAITSVMIKYGAVMIQVDRAEGTTLPTVNVNAIKKELLPGSQIEIGDKGKSGTIVLGDSFEDMDGSASLFVDLTEFGHRVVITASTGTSKTQWLQVFPKPPTKSLTTSSGLMGKYDVTAYKFLVDAFDNVQPASYTPSEMDVQKWKVSADSNIIALNNNDKDIKGTITRRDVSSYPATLQAAAKEVCTGVALQEPCLEDYLSSDGDKGVAYAYGTIESLVTSAEPSEFVSKLSVSDDEDTLAFNQKTFIIVCAAVGAAVFIVVVVLAALLIRKNKAQRQYAVLNS